MGFNSGFKGLRALRGQQCLRSGADCASGDELHTDEACKEEASVMVTDYEESILGPQCATSECWHPTN